MGDYLRYLYFAYIKYNLNNIISNSNKIGFLLTFSALVAGFLPLLAPPDIDNLPDNLKFLWYRFDFLQRLAGLVCWINVVLLFIYIFCGKDIFVGLGTLSIFLLLFIILLIMLSLLCIGLILAFSKRALLKKRKRVLRLTIRDLTNLG